MNPFQVAELIHLFHTVGPDTVLAGIAKDAEMYAACGPEFEKSEVYYSQAEIACLGLTIREIEELPNTPGVDGAILQILRALSASRNIGFSPHSLSRFGNFLRKRPLPADTSTWPELASLARRLAERFAKIKDSNPKPKVANVAVRESNIATLNSWADSLERAIAKREKRLNKSKVKPKTTIKRTTKKGQQRRQTT
jgi:hypothetical protein